jgi:threonine dehydrogenase-like Zn-dependent dehydrogenase
VVAPFAFADGTCRHCSDNVYTSCVDGGFWGGRHDGGQAEAVRVPFADATLVTVPTAGPNPDTALLRRLLPLTDVMATGHHATVLAGVTPGAPVVVVGDGAVGLCAILAATRRGPGRVLAIGRHTDRARVADQFGATDLLEADAPDVADRVVDLTDGGAAAVIECVGTQPALDLALACVRPGGTIGTVGVPNGVDHLDLYRFFRANVGLRAGVAPVRRYLDTLVADVLNGTLDPSPVLTMHTPLAGIADAYRAMDQRQAIKAAVEFD